MIFDTAGHMAAGMSEKDMPSKAMGTTGLMCVKVSVRCAMISKMDEYIIMDALFPLLSAIQPKRGVNSTVQNTGMEVNLPEIAVLRLNLLCRRSVAYFRNGKKAET